MVLPAENSPPPSIALDNTEYQREEYFDEQLGRMSTRLVKPVGQTLGYSDLGAVINPESQTAA